MEEMKSEVLGQCANLCSQLSFIGIFSHSMFSYSALFQVEVANFELSRLVNLDFRQI